MTDPVVLRYVGYYLDAVTGGYPLGHGYRTYLPQLMRFSAPDHESPFGVGGINSYAYCEGDPVNDSDPSGRGLGDLVGDVEAVALHEIEPTFFTHGTDQSISGTNAAMQNAGGHLPAHDSNLPAASVGSRKRQAIGDLAPEGSSKRPNVGGPGPLVLKKTPAGDDDLIQLFNDAWKRGDIDRDPDHLDLSGGFFTPLRRKNPIRAIWNSPDVIRENGTRLQGADLRRVLGQLNFSRASASPRDTRYVLAIEHTGDFEPMYVATHTHNSGSSSLHPIITPLSLLTTRNRAYYFRDQIRKRHLSFLSL